MQRERRPLHVLMILESAFPSSIGGGAEAQVRTLSGALRAQGHRVTVLTPLTATSPQHVVGRVGRTAVCRLRYPHIPLVGGPILWLRLALFLWARRKRYDAWHVHIAHHMGAVCSVFGSWLDMPVIVKVSGWWELERGVLATNASPLSRLARRGLLRATTWQAISHRIGAALIATGIPQKRIAAIPNAVDTARFRAIRRVPATSPRFVFVGRLVPEKGLDTLLRAFQQALRVSPGATLRLVGTGPLMNPLATLARELGIAERIDLSGHREDIETVLADADFGVLPSRIEGLSNTLLEGMAAGLPMIASRVSGSEDLVRSGDNGWMFDPDDVDALARCLAQAALLPVAQRLAMGGRARETVEQHAGMALVADRLITLYRASPATTASTFLAGRSG